MRVYVWGCKFVGVSLVFRNTKKKLSHRVSLINNILQIETYSRKVCSHKKHEI